MLIKLKIIIISNKEKMYSKNKNSYLIEYYIKCQAKI